MNLGGSHSGSSGRSTPSGAGGTGGTVTSATAVSSDPAPGKLFVGGLSWQTSSEKLREYFGMFGNVTDVLIMKDPVTQVNNSIAHFYYSYMYICIYIFIYIYIYIYVYYIILSRILIIF